MKDKFMEWFRVNHPKFQGDFGEVKDFYDSQSDGFLIEEIQDAYEEFKASGEPMHCGQNWRF